MIIFLFIIYNIVSMNIRFFIGFMGLLCLLIYTYRMCDESGCSFLPKEESFDDTDNAENELVDNTEYSDAKLKTCNINTHKRPKKKCVKKPVITEIDLKKQLENKRNISKFIDDELNFPVISMRKVRKHRCMHC